MKNYCISSLEHSTKQEGMYPIFKIIMWMSVFLLIFTVDNVYSQGDSLDCSNSEPCDTLWESSSFLGNLGSGVTGHIFYRYRRCNGIEQIFVDSALALDNAQFLDSMNRYQYKFSAFSELVDIFLLQHRFNDFAFIPWNGDINVTTPVVQLYKASCGVWLKCTWSVNRFFLCDSGYEPPYPIDIGPGNGPLSIYAWQPCGFVCCKKTYQLRRKKVLIPNAGEAWIVEIRNISISKSSYAPCTDSLNFDYPCQDGC